VVISVVIFSIVILSLIGLSFQVAKHSVRSTDQALIIGSMQSKIDHITAVSYDSLAGLATCDTAQSGNASIIGCVTVTSTGLRTSDVQIIVWTTVAGDHPDTVTFTRGKTRVPVPLR
jgi:Tfp pilus assembly protein PilV